MGKRYIDAQPIINFIQNGLNNPDKSKAYGHEVIEILAEIEFAPTADVREVKRGAWICLEQEIGLFECSLCDHRILRTECNFCPNCGADMRKEQINE